MEGVVGHLVRRGVAACKSIRISDHREPAYKLPTWGVALVIGTAVLFLLMINLIGYTYGHVVATLTMVESPTAAVYEPLTNEDPDAPLNEKKTPIEPELILVKQAPITSKLRTTIRHLREREGRLARFRGLSVHFIYFIVLASLIEALSHATPMPKGVSAIVAAVMLARLRTTWVHVVITERSSKWWFQRRPTWKSWTKVAVPTAILATCKQITLTLPKALWCSFGLAKFHDPKLIADLNDAERQLLVIKGLAVILLGFFCAVAIVVPAAVTLTRVQASLIPEEDETIVPFDRTFGGRVVSAAVGGSGSIGILDAWKTFDWNSRVRILKLYVKVVAMQVSMFVLMVVVILGQLNFIMGEEFTRQVALAVASMNN